MSEQEHGGESPITAAREGGSVHAGAVADWAEGCITQWLPGYTDTLDDGRQRRITYLGGGSGALRFRIEDIHGDEVDRVFDISLAAKEVRGNRGEPLDD